MRGLAHRTLALACSGAIACASGTGDGPLDAPPAMPPDGFPCSSPSTWYQDVDQDMHGSAATAIVACEQPAGHVASSDDCDDDDPLRFPGSAELCDGIDNDCASATGDTCPFACAPTTRTDDGRLYLICAQSASWTTAKNVCAGQAFKLVHLDDAGENAWLRGALGSGDAWIGASDSVIEGAWLWDASDQFWQGDEDGAPVAGRFANWESGEPNDDGTEDCGEMKGNGQWNDTGCGDGQRFACERY